MRKLLVVILFLLSIQTIHAQDTGPRTVSGSVRDLQGEAMIGVSVVVKGTTIGTITDVSGFYQIEVPGGDQILSFSYIGMSAREIELGNQTVIDLVMEPDMIGMEEVVVIGYGSVKKRDLTGSVGSVESEKLVSRGGSDAIEALQGQLPGINISRSSGRADVGFDIVIRGQNSIAGGSPLYVVDGLVVDNIDFLNPNDIERMDILKDASSTAIYGS